jgi:hypothetical protein
MLASVVTPPGSGVTVSSAIAADPLSLTLKRHKPVAEEEVEEETDFAKLAMKKLMPKAAKDQY